MGGGISGHDNQRAHGSAASPLTLQSTLRDIQCEGLNNQLRARHDLMSVGGEITSLIANQ